MKKQNLKKSAMTMLALLTAGIMLLGYANPVMASAQPATQADPAAAQSASAQSAKPGILTAAGLFAYYPFGEGRTVNITPVTVAGREYLFLPANVPASNVVFHYNDAVTVMFSDGKILENNIAVNITPYLSPDTGDGSKVLNLKVIKDSVQTDHDLYVMQSSNIPSVYISSSDPAKGRTYVESSKSNKAEGAMTMITSKGTVIYDGALTQIKGRGNTTFTADKKPYQIKLKFAADLTQTGKDNADRTWVLLANAYDPTLIHNSVALRMAKNLGLNSPDFVPVDLYYDGDYRGNYLLCEKVMIAPGRVNITDLEAKNEEANSGTDTSKAQTATGANKYGDVFQYVTGMKNPATYNGGYLLELDNAYYQSERSYFITSTGTPFVVKSPENCSKEEMLFISEYVEEMVRAIQNGGKNPDNGKSVWEYIDKDSLAKFFVVQESVKNADSFASSTYFYLNDDSKPMKAGPVWDFDDSYGIRPDMISSEGFASGGMAELFLTLPEFKKAVKSVYNSKGYSLASNPGIDTAVKEIAASQKMNRVLWNGSAQLYTKLESYDADITAMKKFTAARAKWLNGVFATWN